MSTQITHAETAVDLARIERGYAVDVDDARPVGTVNKSEGDRALHAAALDCQRLARELVDAHARLEAAHRAVFRA